MSTSNQSTTLPTFRVFFHDGRTFAITAASSLIAERDARILHPGGYVKKIKISKGPAR